MISEGLTVRRSFLKWAGGKAASLPNILPHIPDGSTFVDVFAGSGVVALNVAHERRYKRIVWNDANCDVCDVLWEAMTDPAFVAVARALFDYPLANTRECYQDTRSMFNAAPRGLERAAMFLYLNRHGYNGLCRYNRDRIYNVPFGHYDSIYFPDVELAHFHADAVHDVAEIVNLDFLRVMRLPLGASGAGSVYYCDPPYLRAGGFTAYAGLEFGIRQHRALVAAAQDLAERGATVLISNHDEEQTRGLYAGATEIHSWPVRHSVSCGERKLNQELLAIYR